MRSARTRPRRPRPDRACGLATTGRAPWRAFCALIGMLVCDPALQQASPKPNWRMLQHRRYSVLRAAVPTRRGTASSLWRCAAASPALGAGENPRKGLPGWSVGLFRFAEAQRSGSTETAHAPVFHAASGAGHGPSAVSSQKRIASTFRPRRAAVHRPDGSLESRRGSLHLSCTCESRMPDEGAAREGGGVNGRPGRIVRLFRPSRGFAGRNCKG